MEEAIFIPITFFAMVVGVTWLFQHFALKKRIEAFQTLRFAIEKGQPLTPETLEGMARISSPIADLRRGIVFVAIALGFAAFATIISWDARGDMIEVRRGLYGVAMFPLFIGLGFLGLHFFANEFEAPPGLTVAAAEISEADLTKAAMAGDRAAFGQLVSRHQASIRALSRRLARSVADGDDVAQAAFLTAWRRRSTWRGGSFRSWVCAIAYREFLHARRGHASGVEVEETEGEAGESGERLDLMRAMGALDEGERAAIALCLGAGLSHAEAAVAIGAPLGTVKSWVLRGRAKLQKALAAYAGA